MHPRGWEAIFGHPKPHTNAAVGFLNAQKPEQVALARLTVDDEEGARCIVLTSAEPDPTFCHKSNQKRRRYEGVRFVLRFSGALVPSSTENGTLAKLNRLHTPVLFIDMITVTPFRVHTRGEETQQKRSA